MTSPQLLTRKKMEEASQTHGGLFWGHALGNSLNVDIGDFQDFVDGEDLLPVPGKVHLYATASSDPADWDLGSMSHQIFKHPVNSSFRTILQALTEKHSPIQCKFKTWIYFTCSHLNWV